MDRDSERGGPLKPPGRLRGGLIVNPREPTAGEKHLAGVLRGMQPKPPLEIVTARRPSETLTPPPSRPPEALIPPPISPPETLPPSSQPERLSLRYKLWTRLKNGFLSLLVKMADEERRKSAREKFLAESRVDPNLPSSRLYLPSSKFYGKRTFGERVRDFFWELRWRMDKALGKKEERVSASPSDSLSEPAEPPEYLPKREELKNTGVSS